MSSSFWIPAFAGMTNKFLTSVIHSRWPAAYLFVEPDVLPAVAVEDAVDHQCQPLYRRLPAGSAAAVENDRAGAVLRQLTLDQPHQLLALLLVRLDRLLLDQLVNRGVAVIVPIEFRAASITQWKGLIGVRGTLEVEPDDVVPAQHLWEEVGGVDRFELAVDIDLFQLVDQDHRRIAVIRDVARGDFDLEMIVAAIAERLDDLAGLRAVFLDVRVIARQRFEQLGRHAPQPRGCRLHGPADLALSAADDVDKGLAVQGQSHRPPQVGVVEWRLVAIDDQVAVDAALRHLADRLRHLARHVVQQRNGEAEREGHVELSGNKRQSRRREVADDGIFDAVEIRPVLLPIIWIAGHRDPF